MLQILVSISIRLYQNSANQQNTSSCFDLSKYWHTMATHVIMNASGLSQQHKYHTHNASDKQRLIRVTLNGSISAWVPYTFTRNR